MPPRWFSESQRRPNLGPYRYDELPQPFRVQAWMLFNQCIGTVYHRGSDFVRPSESFHAWVAIRDALRYQIGALSLTEQRVADARQECKQFFLAEASTAGVLDVTTLILAAVEHLRPDAYEMKKQGITMTGIQAAGEINRLFDLHHLGYQWVGDMIVRRDSQYAHAEIESRAFSLLLDSRFQGAQSEFHEAHDALRKNDTKKAVVESCKAFESTLKVICACNNWDFDPTASASQLVSLLQSRNFFPPYLKAQLDSVATIRNKAAGHGQGSVTTEVPMYLAAYAMHVAASAIVLLAEIQRESDQSGGQMLHSPTH